MAADMGCRAGRWAVSAEGVMCPPRGQSRKARPSSGAVSGGSWAGNAELLIPAVGGTESCDQVQAGKDGTNTHAQAFHPHGGL